ncbi:MAG: SRPBCC domain-containing protein [Phycisphaeraceae bacterium]|nr:SRPBCC domain-containing protein [Phycisphaeraceae bacterium]
MNQPEMNRGPEVVVQRFIPASPARIFRALTVATELERWLFSDVETQPHKGGMYKMRWRSATDHSRDHDRFGRYLEIEHDRKVVFEWKGDPSQNLGLGDIQSTVVTITLTPEGGGTMVKLVHSGWPTDTSGQDWAGKHHDGWSFYLENLANYLTSGPDLRGSRHGQKVKSPVAG